MSQHVGGQINTGDTGIYDLEGLNGSPVRAKSTGDSFIQCLPGRLDEDQWLPKLATDLHNIYSWQLSFQPLMNVQSQRESQDNTDKEMVESEQKRKRKESERADRHRVRKGSLCFCSAISNIFFPVLAEVSERFNLIRQRSRHVQGQICRLGHYCRGEDLAHTHIHTRTKAYSCPDS